MGTTDTQTRLGTVGSQNGRPLHVFQQPYGVSVVAGTDMNGSDLHAQAARELGELLISAADRLEGK